MDREGILFIGDEGKILAGFLGKIRSCWPRVKRALGGRRRGERRRRYSTWQQAVKGGEPSPGNFLNAAAITDTVNLGTVALRAGRKVLFDSDSMKITNVAEANQYLCREYRAGWEL